VRLGPEDDLAQGQLFPQMGAIYLFRQEQGHRGRGPEAGNLKIHKHLQVKIQIARPHRNGQGAEQLAAELKTGPGCPQPVSHGDLNPIQRRQPGQFIAAGHLQAEHVDIFPGIGQYFPLAGRAAGGVHPHHVALGHAEQRQGIAFAQIVH